jgi:hypothetical protein
MENVEIFYENLEYIEAICYIYCMAIWYIFWSFGIFLPVLVSFTKSILANQSQSVITYIGTYNSS